jgi:ABC-type Fe3+-hydroxamate transport system substrate-binding protein
MKNAPSNPELIENKIEKEMNEILKKVKQDYQDINNEALLTLKNDLLVSGRTLIKEEWDRIKKGEPAYSLAFRTSITFLLIAGLSTLVFVFLPVIKSFCN